MKRVILIAGLTLVGADAHGQTVAENLATHRKIQARAAERNAHYRALNFEHSIPRNYVMGTGGPAMDKAVESRMFREIATRAAVAEERREAAAFEAWERRYKKYHRSLRAANKIPPEDRR